MFWIPKVFRRFDWRRTSTLNLPVDSGISRIQFQTTRRFEHVEENTCACWCCVCAHDGCFGGDSMASLHTMRSYKRPGTVGCDFLEGNW